MPGLLIFINNTATMGGGAIIFSSSQAKLNGMNITFTNNLGTESGGGAIFLKQSVMTSSAMHLYFTNNTAKGTDGGAISGTHSNLTLGTTPNCSHYFFNNSANISGGAVYLVEGSLWIFGNSHFSNNSASQDGGAMSILDSQFVMSGTALCLQIILLEQ